MRDTIEHRQEAIDQFLAEYFKQAPTPDINISALGKISQSSEEILQKLVRNEKFQRLWNGIKTDYISESGEPDDSAADEGFCTILAGFTQDPEQIDGLFRHSKMMRQKWDREDYRQRTITQALAFAAKTFVENQQYDKAIAQLEASMNKTETEADVETSIPGAQAAPVKPLVRVNAGKLVRHLKLNRAKPIQYKSFLAKLGYIVTGWSHLIASGPKIGKTTLLTALLAEWGEPILLFSEEAADFDYAGVWGHRLLKLNVEHDHVNLVPCLGNNKNQIFEEIKNSPEKIIIIDTFRNIIGVPDDNDNAALAVAINPYIALCRELQKTLIILVHDRKGGGQRGEGIAGGHAMLACVDIALEIRIDGNEQSRRRMVVGWGRVNEIQPLLYEMDDQGQLVVLGDPGQVKLDSKDTPFIEALKSGCETAREVADVLEIDVRTAQRNLTRLWRKRKLVIRDPVEDQKKGFEYCWKLVEVNIYDENYKPSDG